MALDVFVLVCLAIAIVKGYRKGLIIALFSFIALVVGAAAALQLSGKAAQYLAPAVPSLHQWIPLIAFLLVFLSVAIVVRLLAKLLEETLKWSMLGWMNKLGGILFYSLLYLVLISIGLFYADKMGVISAPTKAAATSYPILQPLAPVIMDNLGKIVPVFGDLFGQIEQSFEQLGKEIP